MGKIGFFQAVTFGTQSKSCVQTLLEGVDSYFYLGGKKTLVIAGSIQQGSQGVILTQNSPTFFITALKVVSYLTVVIPLILLIAKAILRSIHTFHVVNAKQELEKGIDITPATIEKIRVLMPKILKRQDDPEIRWHLKHCRSLSFSLPSVPNLTFQMDHDTDLTLMFEMAPSGRSVLRAGVPLEIRQKAEVRFANMVKAKEVCLTDQLDRVVVPHAKKIEVDGMALIAEECVNINRENNVQEHLYIQPELNEKISQIATFIAKTGLSDVSFQLTNWKGGRRIANIVSSIDKAHCFID